MKRKKGPKRRTPLNRTLLTLHKWAGLTAGAWLMVLGVTGILLDHVPAFTSWSREVPMERSSLPPV